MHACLVHLCPIFLLGSRLVCVTTEIFGAFLMLTGTWKHILYNRMTDGSLRMSRCIQFSPSQKPLLAARIYVKRREDEIIFEVSTAADLTAVMEICKIGLLGATTEIWGKGGGKNWHISAPRARAKMRNLFGKSSPFILFTPRKMTDLGSLEQNNNINNNKDACALALSPSQFSRIFPRNLTR